MTVADPQRFFFIHVQKTAGTSFRQHLKANFAPAQIYPPTNMRMVEYLDRYVDAASLVALPPPERDAFTMVHGHYPHVTVGRVGGERITISILRDPVDRVVSLLRMNAKVREGDEGKCLEEIYEDRLFFDMQIKDHQAKVFGMVERDESNCVLRDVTMDQERLAIAESNLESVDLLGFQDDLDGLLERLVHRFGWTRAPEPSRENVSEGREASDALRRRIAADNPIDQEFWAFACELRAGREG